MLTVSTELLEASALFTASMLACLIIIHFIPFATRVLDVGHYVIPKMKSHYGPEFLVFCEVWLFVFTSPSSALFLRKMSYLFFFRAFTMGLTILPSLKERDEPIRYLGVFGGKNDYLPFGGHMAFTHLLSLILAETLGPWVHLVDLTLFYLLIAMRRHYTIEMVLSIVASQYVYYL